MSNLADFLDDDLLTEACARGLHLSPLDIDRIVTWLASHGCPAHIIEAIEAWDREPVLSVRTLEAWRKWAQGGKA